MNTTVLGKWGEELAAAYLRKQGYTIVGANYRTRFGEIDLIVKKRRVLAFVEVKLRKNATFGEAREFVTQAKMQRLRTTAEQYLSQNPEKCEPRFDVIEIYAPDGIGGSYTLEHLENAFEGMSWR